METNQDQLRDRVKLRCLSQIEVAKKCQMTNIHFNYWIKGHKDLGPNSVKRVEKFLEE